MLLSPRSLRHPQQRPVLAPLALAAFVACSSPTSTDPLTVSLQQIVFATDAERTAWPSTPSISGGATIRVRGIAYVGCGHPHAAAERHGNFVRVAVTAVDMNGPCPANRSAWAPFEAHVAGLDAGAYRVRVSAVGHEGYAEWQVAIRDF